MPDLPPFPVDPGTLDNLLTAVDPWAAGIETAERSSLNDFLTLMSQLGGSDTDAVEEVVHDGSDGTSAIHMMRDQQYHPNDVIAALIREIQRLRAVVEDENVAAALAAAKAWRRAPQTVGYEQSRTLTGPEVALAHAVDALEVPDGTHP